MRNNRFVCICRALTGGKNSPYMTFVIWMLSSLVIFSFLHLVNVYDLISIATSKETYGKYSISIPYNESYDRIKEDSRVEDTLPVNSICYESDFENDLIYYADERILEFINVSLVEGSYPQESNEIAVDRSYMYKLGIESEEMLGSVIEVLGKTYVVTGILVRNSCFDATYIAREYYFLMNNTTEEYTDVLIELVDLKNYRDTTDAMLKEYNIDVRHCYVNRELFGNLGYLEDDVKETTEKVVYIFFAIIMLIVIHTLSNYIKIWMNNIADDIANMGIMGISFKTMSVVLFAYFTIGIVVCLVIGSLLAILITALVWKANSQLITFEQVLQCVPKKVMLDIVIIYIMVALVQLLWLLLPLMRCNANKLKQEGNILLIGKKFRFRRHFLSMKKPSLTTDLYHKNASENRVGRFATIFGIAISATLFSVGLFYGDLETKSQGYQVDMDYKVEFVDKNVANNRERVIQRIIYQSLKRVEGCKVYSLYDELEEVKLGRDELGDDYLEYLWDVVDSRKYRFHKTAQDFKVNIRVIGYNEQQLRDLYAINEMPYRELKKGEALVLDKTVPMVGAKGFDVNIENELTIKESSYKIVGEVDKLITYEKRFYNRICVIISESDYCDMYNMDVPRELFIKVDNEETLKQAEKVLVGHNVLNLEQPKETYAANERGNRILNAMILAIVAVMLLPIFTSVYSELSLRFHTNKVEYQLYNIVGISKNESVIVFIIEIVTTMIWGILLSLPFTYFITRNMMENSFGKMGLYYYNFPIANYIYLVAFFTIMLGITCLFVRRKISSVGMIRA